jgi:hypothetical protein
MEGSVQICHTCGKENPVQASFCYACGAAFAQPLQPAGDAQAIALEAETRTPEAPYAPTSPQHIQTIPQAAPAPAYPSSKPPKRRRLRCCAIGCLLTLLVLLIGLPVLHITVLRPIIEREIYKQVHKNVAEEQGLYSGADTEIITERQLNDDAHDFWYYLPGSSSGYITLQQDQFKLEVKIYGVKVWAAADIRVNTNGEIMVKSLKMHWLLHILFSEDALKREIADIANEKFVQPKGLYLLAFQVTNRLLFIAYEER